MHNIGFIGVGDLALYTIKGLRRALPDQSILLSPRNREKAALLQREFGCEVLRDNQDVVNQADLVFIATRPADCLDALAKLKFRPGQVLISVVAGLEIENLRSAVLSADIEIVRAMPVSSAEVGASPTLVYPRHDAVVELFDHCGKSIVVDSESAFTQGNILACVYSWFFELFENLIAATRGPLPSELNRELVMGIAAGAAQLALASDDSSPGEIADSIATEGTYSKLGLDLLRQQNAFEAWRDACQLLERRLAESD